MPQVSCSFVKCKNHSKKLKKISQETCNNHKTRKEECGCLPYKLIKFPDNAELKSKWVQLVNRQEGPNNRQRWQPGEHSVVCTIHFKDGMPTTDNPLPVLNVGYDIEQQLGKIPTVRVRKEEKNVEEEDVELIGEGIQPEDPRTGTNTETSAEVCYSDLEVKPLVLPVLMDTVETEELAEPQAEPRNEVRLTADQQNLQGRLMATTMLLKEKTAKLKNYMKPMHKKLITSDKDAVFYTGLPNLCMFHVLTNYMQDFQRRKTQNPVAVTIRLKYRKVQQLRNTKKLSIPDRVLLVLMKLRLGLLNKDLADRFGICSADVSCIFCDTLPLLAEALKPLIVFYPRTEVKKSLPKEYEHFPKLRCIIDCTEFFIHKPSDLKLQAATWSDYKHNNTVKCLVAITPQGSVCYVSELYGGRSSDRHIVTNSGFLDYIDPQDQVLADRGFPVREELLVRQAELVLPPAAKGISQMTSEQVRQTKKVANVRIHVERVIRRLKHFRFLSQVIPISMLTHANHILFVCAAITNMQGPIVNGWHVVGKTV